MLPKICQNQVFRLWCSLLFLIISACSSPSKKADQELWLSPEKQLIFLDSLAASSQIIQDRKEFFFDLVGRLDMSLQLKKNYPAKTSRAAISRDYKAFLQTDVTNFSSDEILFIQEIFQEIFDDCQQYLNTSFFPSTIYLIKTSMKHYGPGVFYTREQAIIIPQDELDNRDKSEFRAVMIHELFHIYSRYHPEIRAQLYDRIGFSIHPCPKEQLEIPEVLKKRILLNPDGINYNYAIQLRDEHTKAFSALPILFSNQDTFSRRKPHFTSYMRFQLFPVQKEYCQLSPLNSLGNLIDLTTHPSFLDQIEENTSYIIHPDEILADNMVLLLQSKCNNPLITPLRVDAEGKQLLRDMEQIMLK